MAGAGPVAAPAAQPPVAEPAPPSVARITEPSSQALATVAKLLTTLAPLPPTAATAAAARASSPTQAPAAKPSQPPTHFNIKAMTRGELLAVARRHNEACGYTGVPREHGAVLVPPHLKEELRELKTEQRRCAAETKRQLNNIARTQKAEPKQERTPRKGLLQSGALSEATEACTGVSKAKGGSSSTAPKKRKGGTPHRGPGRPKKPKLVRAGHPLRRRPVVSASSSVYARV